MTMDDHVGLDLHQTVQSYANIAQTMES